MCKLFNTVSLKLFAAGINDLYHPDWTDYLYEKIEKHINGNIEPIDLLKKPLEKGLPYYLGIWAFESYFSVSHVEYLYGEGRLFFLNDFYEFMVFHNFPNAQPLENLKAELIKFTELYRNELETYCDLLDTDEGNEPLLRLFHDCFSYYSPKFNLLRFKYAEEFSDRILHDRQLCFYISQLLVEIGFKGDNATGLNWVEREYWPERIKAILRARDRGKCASCKTDLTMELDAPVHIDHMIPIAKGGCNDIVNL